LMSSCKFHKKRGKRLVQAMTTPECSCRYQSKTAHR
jgi:hypothetical protein